MLLPPDELGALRRIHNALLLTGELTISPMV